MACLAVAFWMFTLCGCGKPSEPAGTEPKIDRTSIDQPSPGDSDSVQKVVISDTEVNAFCGDCHANPKPEYFPRDGWPFEVGRGYTFYYRSNRTHLKPPAQNDVIAYYRSKAPEKLELPPPYRNDPGKLAFDRTELTWPDNIDAAISHIQFIAEDGTLMVCDMRRSSYCEFTLGKDRSWQLRRRADIPHPAHAERTDLDQDGRPDIVVANLGSFLPEDHDRGSIVWLRPTDDTNFEVIEVQGSLGRVCDVRAADFDADGDIDLLVAEFGWQTTGRILLLDCAGHQDGVPQFEVKVLDDRHGTIHVPLIDFDSDGRTDFVALVSQEHEKVELFMNRQDGFQMETVFAGDDPSFGSSGIELTDLDRDGDIDILYTNGDTYDSFYLKPYHAIHWFENKQPGQWESHELAKLPGVYRALPADMDGDGDLDIVACTMIPDKLLTDVRRSTFNSLVWLEQTEPKKFVVHALESGNCQHAVLEVGDFDNDGDVDIAVGNFEDQVPITFWWNKRVGEK